MTIENLLNKARQAAIDKVWPYYLDICDGNETEAKEWIEHERKAGVRNENNNCRRWFDRWYRNNN